MASTAIPKGALNCPGAEPKLPQVSSNVGVAGAADECAVPGKVEPTSNAVAVQTANPTTNVRYCMASSFTGTGAETPPTPAHAKERSRECTDLVVLADNELRFTRGPRQPGA